MSEKFKNASATTAISTNFSREYAYKENKDCKGHIH
jgi:hypothetical protein